MRLPFPRLWGSVLRDALWLIGQFIDDEPTRIYVGFTEKLLLTRWRIFDTGFLGVYLHRFVADDVYAAHDHRWSFATLVLCGDYIDETLAGHRESLPAGTVQFRRHDHIHRVRLGRSNECWTLVLRGRNKRPWWGFYHPGEKQPFLRYDAGAATWFVQDGAGGWEESAPQLSGRLG